MSISSTITRRFSKEEPNSLSSLKQSCNILSQDNIFVSDVLNCLSIDEQKMKMPLIIGNVKQLLSDIQELDQQTEKVDIIVNLKDIFLEKYMDNDHVLFNIYGIQDQSLIEAIKADHLIVESQYSARSDIMEYYQFSKFSNFLHSNEMDSYAQQIWDKIRLEANKNKKCMARLIYHKEDEKYYVRAVTSENGYKNYGINFSVLVLLLAVNEYVKQNSEQAFIDSYTIDDSHILLSVQFDREIKLKDNMSLSLNLILENDEIRQSAVSLNAEFKVVYKYGKRESSIYLKPTAYQRDHGAFSEDMLTFSHGMNVKTVIDKISQLPLLLNKYIELVSKNAIEIAGIKNPQEVKEYIQSKILRSRKEEFSTYKDAIVRKLVSIDVNSVFELFDLLRNVEELFGDDILSKNYWRQKLYDALINRGKKD